MRHLQGQRPQQLQPRLRGGLLGLPGQRGLNTKHNSLHHYRWFLQKNDDRILQCCLALNSSPPATIENGIKTVHRDTVLITDDRWRKKLEEEDYILSLLQSSISSMIVYVRNLRLKAHTADCAVNSIKEFLNWVKTVKKQWRSADSSDSSVILTSVVCNFVALIIIFITTTSHETKTLLYRVLLLSHSHNYYYYLIASLLLCTSINKLFIY